MTWFEKMMDEIKKTPEFKKEMKRLENERYCETAVNIVWPLIKEKEMNKIEKIRLMVERVPESADWSTATVKLLLAEITRLEREKSNWVETAKQYCKNEAFYCDLLDQIAGHLGKKVFISDDGSIQDSPIRLKIPELVSRLEAENKDLKFKLSCHTSDCIADYEEMCNRVKELEGELAEANLQKLEPKVDVSRHSLEVSKLEKESADLSEALAKALDDLHKSQERVTTLEKEREWNVVTLQFCDKHNTICMPYLDQLACCLAAKVKELERGIDDLKEHSQEIISGSQRVCVDIDPLLRLYAIRES